MPIDHSKPWNTPPPPPRQPKPGEMLFGTRGSDGSPMRVELRFHGESFGWEVQVFDRGGFLSGRGAFTLRGLAVQWAEQERKAIESER